MIERVTRTAIVLCALVFVFAGCGDSGGGETIDKTDTGTDVAEDTGEGTATTDDGQDQPDTHDPGSGKIVDDGGEVADEGVDPGGDEDIPVDDGVETPDEGVTIDESGPADDGGPPLCQANAHCQGLFELSDCQIEICQDGKCVVAKEPGCCLSPLDCDENNECTEDDCPEQGGKCTHTALPTCCSTAQVILEAFFDDGTLNGFDIIDQDENDGVTWQLDTERAHSGEHSLYLGDPTCHTYYNGGLGDDCELAEGGAPATRVQISLTSPPLTLPEDSLIAGSVWLFSAVEPMLPVALNPNGELPEPDALSLRVNTFDTRTEIFTTASINKTTGGVFRFLTFDLSPFSGQSVELELAFDSFDGSDNLFEGIYVDTLRIFTYCGSSVCREDGNCKDDGSPCTMDVCTGFSNVADDGLCAYPIEREPCDPCVLGVADCPDKECMTVTCGEDDICDYRKEVSEQCCVPESAYQEGFEVKDEAWLLGQAGTGSVGWHLADGRSTAGDKSLHFGKETAPGVYTYDNNGGRSAATATSPSILVPKVSPVATFDLYLSTEFDDATDYFPFDRLWVGVDGEVEELWSSDTLEGSTHGEFVQVTVDLSAYAEQELRLTFTFDSGNAEHNDYEGPFIDDLQVWSACNPPICSVPGDCDDENACTADVCDLGSCTRTELGGECCLTDLDCDDADSCTNDLCTGNRCTYTPTDGHNCCVETTWQFSSFETGDEGFAPQEIDPEDQDLNKDTVWTRFQHGAKDGEFAFYFGDPLSRDLGAANGAVAQGTLRSGPIQVPESEDSTSWIEFWVDLQTSWALDFNENDLPDGLDGRLAEDLHELYLAIPAEDVTVPLLDGTAEFKEDLLFVRVLEPGETEGAPPLVTNVWYSGFLKGYTDGYEHVAVDLSAWAGKTVEIEWFFSTYFAPRRSLGGVFVDSVAFASTCKDKTEIECVGAHDCAFDGDDCSANTCAAFKCGTKAVIGPGCCVPDRVWPAEGPEGFEDVTLEVYPDHVVNPGARPYAWEEDAEWRLDDLSYDTPNDNVTWQASDLKPHEGEKSMYYGDETTQRYNEDGTWSSATLYSPHFTLPEGEDTEVVFWLYNDTEAFFFGFEQLLVEVIPLAPMPPNVGNPEDRVVLLDTYEAPAKAPKNDLGNLSMGQWHEVRLGGLAEMAGRTVRLKIAYDTIGDHPAELPNLMGPFIDELEIRTVCGAGE